MDRMSEISCISYHSIIFRPKELNLEIFTFFESKPVKAAQSHSKPVKAGERNRSNAFEILLIRYER